jgi:hypothetical protein
MLPRKASYANPISFPSVPAAGSHHDRSTANIPGQQPARVLGARRLNQHTLAYLRVATCFLRTGHADHSHRRLYETCVRDRRDANSRCMGRARPMSKFMPLGLTRLTDVHDQGCDLTPSGVGINYQPFMHPLVLASTDRLSVAKG